MTVGPQWCLECRIPGMVKPGMVPGLTIRKDLAAEIEPFHRHIIKPGTTRLAAAGTTPAGTGIGQSGARNRAWLDKQDNPEILLAPIFTDCVPQSLRWPMASSEETRRSAKVDAPSSRHLKQTLASPQRPRALALTNAAVPTLPSPFLEQAFPTGST